MRVAERSLSKIWRLHSHLRALPSEFGAGLQAAVEQLQQALDRPEIRDEAMQVLRGLIEHVAIGSAGEGLEIEIVGEIAKMVELGIGPMQNRPTSMRD